MTVWTPQSPWQLLLGDKGGKPTGCGKGAAEGLTSVSRCCESLHLNSPRLLASLFRPRAKFSSGRSLTCPRSCYVHSHAKVWKPFPDSLSPPNISLASFPFPILMLELLIFRPLFLSLLSLPLKWNELVHRPKAEEVDGWFCCSWSVQTRKEAVIHSDVSRGQM